MPLTHTRTFRVRYYECDALGYAAPATFLRYMQETAFDASAAAGYGMARYLAMQRTWLIRQTEIETARPLRYGDAVEVKTWVADFRRVRSRRAYEFRLAGSGELVAQAETDWAFLDTATQRPAAIPSELIAGSFPEGMPQSAPPRVRQPWPPVPLGAFRQRRRVEWSDLDAVQHVNNAVHVAYLEDSTREAISRCGWPLERLGAAGMSVMPLRQSFEYLQPAVWGDELELVTWMEEGDAHQGLRYAASTRCNDGAPVCRSRTVWACLDLQTGRRIPVPDPLLHDLLAGPR